MSDELREILRVLTKVTKVDYKWRIDNAKDDSVVYTTDDESNIAKAVGEIKQRVRALVGKDKELLKTNPLSDDIIYQSNHEIEIHNQAKAEFRKKIEEG